MCIKYPLAVYLIGTPIGYLFPSASIPFHYAKKHHCRPPQSNQRKRILDYDQAVDSVSSAKRYKHQPQHSDICESTSNCVDSGTSHVSLALQPNPLEMSELYLTACESPVDNESVENPAVDLSHCKSADRGKKRKHQNTIQLISKIRLRLGYNQVIKAPRTRRKTTFKRKGNSYCVITIL